MGNPLGMRPLQLPRLRCMSQGTVGNYPSSALEGFQLSPPGRTPLASLECSPSESPCSSACSAHSGLG